MPAPIIPHQTTPDSSLYSRGASSEVLVSRWGNPPTPLLPTQLRVGRFIDEPLGPSLAVGLRLPPNATFQNLDGEYWTKERPPCSVQILEALAKRVFRLREAKKAPALIGRISSGDLQALPFRPRTWNCLDEAGFFKDPAALLDLSIGDLLELNNFGNASAIDFCAVTDSFLGSQRQQLVTFDHPVIGHAYGVPSVRGIPFTPLVPSALRNALSGQAVPRELIRSLNWSGSITINQLDSSFWKEHGDALSSDDIEILNKTIFPAIEQVTGARILMREWPGMAQLTDLPLSPRTVRCIKEVSEELGFTPEDYLATGITYGELLDIPTMGAGSVIELACVLEQYDSLRMDINADHCHELSNYVTEHSEENWTASIFADDPHFSAVIPPGPESLQEFMKFALDSEGQTSSALPAAASALRGAIKIKNELEEGTLASGLHSLLTRLVPKDDYREAILRRWGWDCMAAATLQEAGDILGVSRQRLEQIEKEAKQQLPSHGPFLPQLESVRGVLEGMVPTTAKEALTALQDLGLTRLDHNLGQILKILEQLQVSDSMEVVALLGRPMLLQCETKAAMLKALRMVEKTLKQVGAICEEDVTKILEVQGEKGLALKVVMMVPGVEKVLIDGAQWYLRNPISSDPFGKLLHRILSVAPRISISQLHSGLLRWDEYRRKSGDVRPAPIPTEQVVLELLTRRDGTLVDRAGTITVASPEEPSQALTHRCEQAFAVEMAGAPQRTLHFNDLIPLVLEHGVPESTIRTFLSYSPLVFSPKKNYWTLIGDDSLTVDREQHMARVQELQNEESTARELAAFWAAVGKIEDVGIGEFIKVEGDQFPDAVFSSSVRFVRDPSVVAFSRMRASFNCEVPDCSFEPFSQKEGRIYLEVHHLVPLAEGGADTPQNTAALCPNHHREVHYGIHGRKLTVLLQEKRNDDGLHEMI